MIYFTKNTHFTKVLIKDSCDTDDLQELHTILEEENRIEISFISIDTILAKTIKLLLHYKDKIKLSTDSHSLWLYLRGISIEISHYKHTQNVTIPIDMPLKAIGIGGSAGSLSNIIKIIQELPYSDITIFIVMHILPDKESKLVEIIEQYTNYKVKEPIDGAKIELNTIYVASPNKHMIVKNGCIYNTNTQKVNFCRPSIDVLFETLALEYKESLLSILTCGYLDDGVKSLSSIKDNGGISLIQNPNECEANDIPLNAICTKNYTHIFSLDKINEYIKIKLNSIIDLENRIRGFISNVYKVYHYDFRAYDIKSVTRRVELLRVELGINNLIEFENLALKDRDIFNQLFKKLSINVSDFFRDPTVFKQIREDIVPILETYPHIRIWCSACSHGEEPYSVAMMLDEVGLLDRSIIYATDFNETVLNEAKNGIFAKKHYEEYKSNFIRSGGKTNFDKWFEINDNYVEITPHIKEKVHFFQHNLVTDGEINEFHLVFCRNVLIYFDEKLQKRVFHLIHGSLIRDGFLVLGRSEMVYVKDGFKEFKESSKNKIFKKYD